MFIRWFPPDAAESGQNRIYVAALWSTLHSAVLAIMGDGIMGCAVVSLRVFLLWVEYVVRM